MIKRLQMWWPILAALFLLFVGGLVFPTRFEMDASKKSSDQWREDIVNRLERIENLLLNRTK